MAHFFASIIAYFIKEREVPYLASQVDLEGVNIFTAFNLIRKAAFSFAR